MKTCLVLIFILAYFTGIAQESARKFILRDKNSCDSISQEMDSNKEYRLMIFGGTSPLIGEYNGRARMISENEGISILDIPLDFIKVRIRIYVYHGKIIRVNENNDTYYILDSVYFNKLLQRETSSAIINRITAYCDIYLAIKPGLSR